MKAVAIVLAFAAVGAAATMAFKAVEFSQMVDKVEKVRVAESALNSAARRLAGAVQFDSTGTPFLDDTPESGMRCDVEGKGCAISTGQAELLVCPIHVGALSVAGQGGMEAPGNGGSGPGFDGQWRYGPVAYESAQALAVVIDPLKGGLQAVSPSQASLSLDNAKALCATAVGDGTLVAEAGAAQDKRWRRVVRVSDVLAIKGGTYVKDPVETEADLASLPEAPQLNDIRLIKDSNKLMRFNGSSWVVLLAAEEAADENQFGLGPQPAGMVLVEPSKYTLLNASVQNVKPFYIGKYEASIGVDGLPRHVAGVLPELNKSWTEAKALCEKAGWALPSADQWTALAFLLADRQGSQGPNWIWDTNAAHSGEMYRGHHGASTSVLSASLDDNDGYYGTGQVAGTRYKRTLVLPSGERIWDIAGNAPEWIDLFLPLSTFKVTSVGSDGDPEFCSFAAKDNPTAGHWSIQGEPAQSANCSVQYELDSSGETVAALNHRPQDLLPKNLSNGTPATATFSTFGRGGWWRATNKAPYNGFAQNTYVEWPDEQLTTKVAAVARGGGAGEIGAGVFTTDTRWGRFHRGKVGFRCVKAME